MNHRYTQIDTEFLYEEESYQIRGAIFEVYKEMGPGFLEAVYQECLHKEFINRKIPCSVQSKLDIYYKGELLRQTYIPDFICFDKILIEIKGINNIAPQHRAQLLNYLKASNMKLGFLVNFGHFPKVEIERIVK